MLDVMTPRSVDCSHNVACYTHKRTPKRANSIVVGPDKDGSLYCVLHDSAEIFSKLSRTCRSAGNVIMCPCEEQSANELT